MKKTPKVSVLMPVYNTKEEYLREAIESILSQTYTDFEFVIINDGSKNNAKDVILSYHDKRIKYFEQENHGLIYTLNKGIDLCLGDYIARMDSDDISLPERLAKQVQVLDNNPNVGIVGGLIRIFPNSKFEKKYEANPKYLDLIRENQLAHPVVMFRKSVLEQYNLRYNDCLHAEDFELWSRLIKFTNIHNVQEVLLKYRHHGSNISLIHSEKQNQNTQKVKQNMLDFLTNDRQIQKRICKLLGCQYKNKQHYNFFERIFSIKNSPNKKYKYIHILGICIKLKRKRHSLHYNQIQVDDSQLLAELSQLGNFSYMPNSGNIGDMLIAEATMRWFDSNKINWQRVKPSDYPQNLVYGGGGAWIANWVGGLAHVMDIMKNAKKIIILPSSFNNVPDFIDILDERFVVFCREKKSYDYLISHHTGAKILLDHDMAFRLSGKLICPLKAPSRKLKKQAKKLWVKVTNIKEEASLFRMDEETSGHYNTDLDLSNSLGWFSSYEKRENIKFAVNTMFEVLNKLQTIKTDRLHVGIAAALLGKKVFLYDNSYGKISGVYNQTMFTLPNVILEQ